jgi:hypothetical protein
MKTLELFNTTSKANLKLSTIVQWHLRHLRGEAQSIAGPLKNIGINLSIVYMAETPQKVKPVV